MVVITKKEKEKILEAFPSATITRMMKKHSQRHHYCMEEHPALKVYLEQLRKANVISESGAEVSYPEPNPAAVKAEYFGKKEKDSKWPGKTKSDKPYKKYSKDYKKNGNQQNNFGKQNNKGNNGGYQNPNRSNYNAGGNNSGGNWSRQENRYESRQVRKPRTDFKPKGGWKSDGGSGNWGGGFDKEARFSHWDDRSRNKNNKNSYKKDKWQ